MSIINVQCTDQVLAVTNSPVIASGGVNEDYIQFSFCSLWTGFTKTAVFYVDEETTYTVLIDANDQCVVPSEVLANPGKFFFGVYGVSGSVTRTSEVLFYTVKKGAVVGGQPAPEPTPNIYQQILAALATKVDKVASATQGNFPSFASGGGLQDSGKKAAHYDNAIGGLGNAIGMRGWNQLVNPKSNTVNGITISVSNGKYTLSGTATASGGRLSSICDNFHMIANHKYYVSRSASYGDQMFIESGSSILYTFSPRAAISEFWTPTADATAYIGINVSTGTTYTESFYLQIVDVTALFGAGNEPSSVADFRAMFPADYYPYCSGSWADLLWTNASPSSAFAAQTVPVDHSNYKFLLVIAKSEMGSGFYLSTMIDKSYTLQSIIAGVHIGKSVYRYTNATSNGVLFDNGKVCNTYASITNDNSYCIPYQIYGIK